MLRDIEHIRKSARERAARRWHNYQVEKQFKAAQKEAAEKAAKETKPVEVADVIEPDKRVNGAVTKFESKYIKDLREMLQGHEEETMRRSVALYLISLKMKKRRLLLEKLRRHQAAQNQGEAK
jgi:hypothetical protein